MQSLRIRIKASDFKEVKRKGELTYIRWDAIPETIQIPKGRPKKGQEQQYETKETGFVICSELCVKGEVNIDRVHDAVAKDLALRYPEGGAPEVKIIL